MGNPAAGRAGNCEVIVEVSGGAAAGRYIRQRAGMPGGGAMAGWYIRWRAGIAGRGRDGGRVYQAVGTAAGEWGGRLGGGGCTELRSRA